MIASNKADADSKNVATNDRIAAENAAQDVIIQTNNTVTNDRITTETNRLDDKNTSQDNVIASNKADAAVKNTVTNDRITTETQPS